MQCLEYVDVRVPYASRKSSHPLLRSLHRPPVVQGIPVGHSDQEICTLVLSVVEWSECRAVVALRCILERVAKMPQETE
jgi:hypothetical protein